MKHYAITGGIGTGKSFVCKALKAKGIEVYDCDDGAKRLMRSDASLQKALSELIGRDVFPRGAMDKAAIAEFLLRSQDNVGKINAIVHPAVLDDFMHSGMAWMESAILFEAGFDRYVDGIVCVSAPLEIRLQRIMLRDGITREKAMEWVERQMSQEEKEQRSDFVIINDGTRELDSQITAMLKTLYI